MDDYSVYDMIAEYSLVAPSMYMKHFTIHKIIRYDDSVSGIGIHKHWSIVVPKSLEHLVKIACQDDKVGPSNTAIIFETLAKTCYVTELPAYF